MLKYPLILAVAATLLLQAGRDSKRAEAAEVPAQSAAALGNGTDIFHVAIFRFTQEHVSDATGAFRELAAAARQEPGNLGYDIYRSKDDNQAFYIVEHWASPAALSAHERSEAFIHLGQGVLAKYATLHDTMTAGAFDVVNPPVSSR